MQRSWVVVAAIALLGELAYTDRVPTTDLDALEKRFQAMMGTGN